MDLISKSEGLTHICESILQHLDHKTLLSCKLVNSNFKRILSSPLFWIKILKRDYGINDLLQELQIIATFIGQYKYEEIKWNNSRCYRRGLQLSFSRSLRKFHGILNTENNTIIQSMNVSQFAASFGSTELIELLKSLNRWEELNYILNAAYFGNFEAVYHLFDEPAYRKPRNGRTPIHMASEKGHLEIVRFCVQNGHDPNPKCVKRITPIYLASKNGKLDVVKYLINYIDRKNVFVSDIDNGFSPIHVAVINGHLDVLKILSIFTENPNAMCDWNNQTPIHLAAYYNHLEILKFLVPLVKDPFIPNSEVWDALDIAGQKGHFEIVKYLTSVIEERGLNLSLDHCSLYNRVQQNKPDENILYYTSCMIIFVSIVLDLFNLF